MNISNVDQIDPIATFFNVTKRKEFINFKLSPWTKAIFTSFCQFLAIFLRGGIIRTLTEERVRRCEKEISFQKSIEKLTDRERDRLEVNEWIILFFLFFALHRLLVAQFFNNERIFKYTDMESNSSSERVFMQISLERCQVYTHICFPLPSLSDANNLRHNITFKARCKLNKCCIRIFLRMFKVISMILLN